MNASFVNENGEDNTSLGATGKVYLLIQPAASDPQIGEKLSEAMPEYFKLVPDKSVMIEYRYALGLFMAYALVEETEDNFFSFLPAADMLSQMMEALLGEIEEWKKCEWGDFRDKLDAAFAKIVDKSPFHWSDKYDETGGDEVLTEALVADWPAATRWVGSLSSSSAFGILGVDDLETRPSAFASDLYMFFGVVGAPDVDLAAGTAGSRTAAALFKYFGDADVGGGGGAATVDTIRDGLSRLSWSAGYDGTFGTGPSAIREAKDRAAYGMAQIDGEASSTASAAVAGRNVRLINSNPRMAVIADIIRGETSGRVIASGLRVLCESLKIYGHKLLDESALLRVAAALAPHRNIVSTVVFETVLERVQGIIDALARTGSNAFSGGEGGGQGGGRGETHMRAHSADLAATMGTDEAGIQLTRMAYALAHVDDICAAEAMLSGCCPPELRKVIDDEIALMAAESKQGKATFDVKRAGTLTSYQQTYLPLAPLHQSCFGVVKTIVGFPELTPVREVVVNRFAELLGRVVARVVSPCGTVVQGHLQFLQLHALAEALTGGAEAIGGVDLLNTALLPLQSKNCTGHVDHFERVPDGILNRCPWQVRLLEHIAPAVLQLIGVPISREHGWGRIHSAATFMCLSTGFAQPQRADRLTTGLHSLVTESLHAVGRLVHQMRTSARPGFDMGSIRLVPVGGAPIQKWNQLFISVAICMQRERTEADSGTGERGPRLRLPTVLVTGKRAATGPAAGAPPPKRVSFGGEGDEPKPRSGTLAIKVRVKEAGGGTGLSPLITFDNDAAQRAMQAAKKAPKGYCMFCLLGECRNKGKCDRCSHNPGVSLKQFVVPPSKWPANAAI